jgi:DNA replication protein DnaC
MIAPDQDLDTLFKRLHLANARRVWRDLVQRAEREAWSYQDFLTLLVTEEIAHRQQTRLARLTRWAHFPFLKTIDDFNFTYQSSLRLHMLGSALAPDFVTEGRSLIFSGKPGRGKTHLAVAIAYRAIQNGFDAVFITAATLIDDLSAAFREGQLAQALQAYTHPAVLVVDEVGYLTYGTDAANMLFHVVNERHRRQRSMIFTTNKALKAWGRVLHDEDLGQAIIDRILERGRLIRLDGPSVRTLHLKLDDVLKEDSDQDDEVARISGITRPEFPEPTVAAAHDVANRPDGGVDGLLRAMSFAVGSVRWRLSRSAGHGVTILRRKWTEGETPELRRSAQAVPQRRVSLSLLRRAGQRDRRQCR